MKFNYESEYTLPRVKGSKYMDDTTYKLKGYFFEPVGDPEKYTSVVVSDDGYPLAFVSNDYVNTTFYKTFEAMKEIVKPKFYVAFKTSDDDRWRVTIEKYASAEEFKNTMCRVSDITAAKLLED